MLNIKIVGFVLLGLCTLVSGCGNEHFWRSRLGIPPLTKNENIDELTPDFSIRNNYPYLALVKWGQIHPQNPESVSTGVLVARKGNIAQVLTTGPHFKNPGPAWVYLFDSAVEASPSNDPSLYGFGSRLKARVLESDSTFTNLTLLEVKLDSNKDVAVKPKTPILSLEKTAWVMQPEQPVSVVYLTGDGSPWKFKNQAIPGGSVVGPGHIHPTGALVFQNKKWVGFITHSVVGHKHMGTIPQNAVLTLERKCMSADQVVGWFRKNR